MEVSVFSARKRCKSVDINKNLRKGKRPEDQACVATDLQGKGCGADGSCRGRSSRQHQAQGDGGGGGAGNAAVAG